MPDTDLMERLPAMILAGGFGTRLRPVASDCPKALVEINGRPFLAYLLDQLERSGIRKVVLCTGYRASMISAAIGSRHGKLHIHHSCEVEPLGTAGALRLALKKTREDDILVMNGDSYFDVDLRSFIKLHQRAKAHISMLLAHVDDIRRYGSIQTNEKNEVRRFIEKDGNAGPGWINSGIYLFHRQTLRDIPLRKKISLEKDILPAWSVGKFRAFRGTGCFIDIGTPESFAAAKRFFQELDPEQSDRPGIFPKKRGQR